MADVVGICNSALVKIGANRITSVFPPQAGSKAANLCAERYEDLRDDLLRANLWRFAKARQKLAKLSESPVYEWDNAFRLPSDLIRIAVVHDNDAGAGEVRHQVEGETIVTNATDIWLTYGKLVEDPNQMPVDFRESLASIIARELAIPIRNSRTLRNEMDTVARRKLARARATGAMEDYPKRRRLSGWVRSRFRGTGRSRDGCW